MSFRRKEHVIPQWSGVFGVQTPIIRGDLVCDACNQHLGDTIEHEFKQDSAEGFFADRYAVKPERATSNRRLGKRMKVTRRSNQWLGVFKDAPFSFDRATGRMLIRPSFVMDDHTGQAQTFFSEKIEKLTGTELEKKKKEMSRLKQTGIRVFGDESFPAERTIALLGRLGITYSEKEREVIEVSDSLRIIEDFAGRMDQGSLRVPTKIVLEYFAYCATKSGWRDILFLENFNDIREFVLRGTTPPPPSKIIRAVDNKIPVHGLGETAGVHPVKHTLLFGLDQGLIVGKVSLFGWYTYEVVIGKCPRFRFMPMATFGCGHLFDPIYREVDRLYGSPTPLVHGDSFSLFRK